MAKKKEKGRRQAFEEIERLKAKRRLDLIKILACVAIILVLIWINAVMQTSGSVNLGEVGSMVESAVLWMTAFVLAIFAGSAGIDLSKCARAIEEICERNGITKEDIKAYEQG